MLTRPPVKSKTACLSITNKNTKCYSLLDTNEVLEREDTTGSDLAARRRLDLERLENVDAEVYLMTKLGLALA